MRIDEVKMKSIGTKIAGLDVVITTAGKRTQREDKTWEQKLGLTDVTGHIWAILEQDKNIPIIKSNELTIAVAVIEEIENKGGEKEKILRITKFERKTQTVDELLAKDKFEGVLDPIIENILEKYGISPIDALWPLTRTDKKTQQVKTQWIIYHRYCEQIAAKAGIVFEKPKVEVNDREHNEVVLLIAGRMGHTIEWSYGEASAKTTILPYIWAMAEKRGKDRVILKLAGFHGMLYSDTEENWKNDK